MKPLLLAAAFALGVSGVEVQRYDPPSNLCPYIGHPQYKCPDPIWCFDTWPHATNYYGNKSDPLPDKDNFYYLLGGYGNFLYQSREFYESKKPAVGKRGNEPETHIVTKEQDTKADGLKNQCCAPTLDCYNHIKSAKRVRVNGDTYIEDFDDWQKAVCCMFDFVTPKPERPGLRGCAMPDTTLPIKWRQPPYCSNEQTYYECKPLPNQHDCRAGEDPDTRGDGVGN